ncbi:RES family NAD+ phosphorylase [Pseudomonas sp. 22515]|uniref:RES family NAD+ phosphorylase n=1 Tax=Pseudomonas sp. 22515 TaxID=3453934 RepID=UPI003F8420D4
MTFESQEEITRNPSRNLAAPPKQKASGGRMNAAGVPVFYGALDRETCISELRPPVGCTVVSGEFRLNDEIRVLDFKRIEKADLGPEPSFFDQGYYVKSGRRELLRYLHNEITIPVLPGAEAEYLTSQIIAEYLATCCKPRIDGVIFKSVQNPPGSNIVLFSHVACAETALLWKLNGAQGISGGKASDKPRIDYVADSLVAHPIRRVKYLDNEPDQDEG